MSLGLVASGILDTVSFFAGYDGSFELGIVEIVSGVVLSILSSFAKGRMKPAEPEEVQADGMA